MGRTLLSLALIVVATGAIGPLAHAATTQEFFDLCGNDQEACARQIDDVRTAYEKKNNKLCPPATMSREGYANEITYWIGEQQPPLNMNQDDARSITAALKALYACKPSQGAKP
jgi:hypothetical protein